MYVQPSTTIEAIVLYFELCKRGIAYAELEKWDGHKTIDIAIGNARLNIEIDGSHHNWNPIQAIADLKRTFFSLQKGYFTLRIPNSLIHNHLDETADIIASIVDATINNFNESVRRRDYYKTSNSSTPPASLRFLSKDNSE